MKMFSKKVEWVSHVYLITQILKCIHLMNLKDNDFI